MVGMTRHLASRKNAGLLKHQRSGANRGHDFTGAVQTSYRFVQTLFLKKVLHALRPTRYDDQVKRRRIESSNAASGKIFTPREAVITPFFMPTATTSQFARRKVSSQ